MNRVYVVFESSASFTHPLFRGIFSSLKKARRYIDSLYESRFRILCSDPDADVLHSSYFFVTHNVN